MTDLFECETCGKPISIYVEAKFLARINLVPTNIQNMPDHLQLIVGIHEESPTLSNSKLLLKCEKCISVQKRPDVTIIKKGKFHEQFTAGKASVKAIVQDLVLADSDIISFSEATMKGWFNIKQKTQLVNTCLQGLVRRSDIKDECKTDS